MDYNELMDKAREASEKAYAPYSKFKVGACVLSENGKFYTGCNFENSSYGLTICAERNAIGTAICDGEQKLKQSQFIHQILNTAILVVLADRLCVNLPQTPALRLFLNQRTD